MPSPRISTLLPEGEGHLVPSASGRGRGRAAFRYGTTRALQDFVKSQLTPYKYPRRFIYLDALPKTGTDKVDRQGLKRLA